MSSEFYAREIADAPVSDFDRKPVEWVIPGLVPQGMLTVLAGAPKAGKSMLTLLWAAALSQQEKTVMLLTREDDVSVTIRPRLEACGADLGRIRIVDPVELPEPEDVLGLEMLIFDRKPSLIVIDPIVAFMSERHSSNSDHGVRTALDPLRVIAERAQCAVLWLQHLNKASGMGPLDRIGGSVAFGALPRSVMLFGRKPETDEDENWRAKRVLIHYACNVAPEQESMEYQIEPIALEQMGSQPMVTTARLSYVGRADVDAETMLGPREDGERGDRQRAKALICSYLAVRDVPSKDLMEYLDENGVSEKTAKRARVDLGVEVERRGKAWWCKALVTPAEAKGATLQCDPLTEDFPF